MVVDAVPIPEDFPEAVQTRCTRSSTCLSLRLCSEIRCLGCVNTLQSFVGYMGKRRFNFKRPKADRFVCEEHWSDAYRYHARAEKRVSHAKVMGELVRMGVVGALPSSPATLVMNTAKVDEGDKKPAAVSMLKHNPVNKETVVEALPSAPVTPVVKTAEEDEGDKKPAAVSMLKHNPTNNQTIPRTPGIQMVEALADNVCWASPDTLNKPPAMIVAGDETNTRKKRSYTRSFSDFETAQGHKIKDMPGHMQPVATNRQSMLEAKAAAFDRIIGIAHNKKKFVKLLTRKTSTGLQMQFKRSEV